MMSGAHAWAGETDFKTFRKAAQGEINLQKKIIEQDPLDFLSYFELGLAYLKLGRHEEEVKAYQEALSLSPKSAQVHYNLSIAHDHLKEGGKAIHHMQKAQGLYVTQRNHRKIRTTQRQLKRFYFNYPQEFRALNTEK
ncbi:MAG: tetratricopeptide repeat protein [Nitrospina sp.]|jgi:tetratricopeptide (TPR) repeat protein|nr:tetratricopeptide repeat protein [Nitrospina sp.]